MTSLFKFYMHHYTMVIYWTTLLTQNQTIYILYFLQVQENLNITYFVSSIVTQFYQKLKHLFMKMKVELSSVNHFL